MLNNDMINMLLQIENENNEKKDYIQELISFFYSIQFNFPWSMYQEQIIDYKIQLDLQVDDYIQRHYSFVFFLQTHSKPP